MLGNDVKHYPTKKNYQFMSFPVNELFLDGLEPNLDKSDNEKSITPEKTLRISEFDRSKHGNVII